MTIEVVFRHLIDSLVISVLPLILKYIHTFGTFCQRKLFYGKQQ